MSPLTGLLAAARQMQAAYRALHDRGTLRDDLDLVLSFDDFNPVVGLDHHYELERRYSAVEES